MRHISFNGELFPAKDFTIGLKNRAFRYGDGLFETIRSHGTRMPFFDYHYARLYHGMDVFRMVPGILSKTFLRDSAERLIKADKLFNGNSVRVSVFRKEGGKYTPQTSEVDFLIEAEPVADHKFVLNDKGLFIDTFEDHFKSSSPIGNFKNSSALLAVLAGINMQQRKLDDILILNEKNVLVEALSSNIFLYKGNKLFTPSLNTGCVDGVMRRVLLEIAGEQNIDVEESDRLVPEDLLTADEVFISNAMRGINWVVAYKNKRYLYKMSRFLMSEINRKAGF
ncbi:aminotransferase class IV [Saccharicrinis sp. FJH54]|uniref:aminotransferase class IV n=1 Tax=Saccharicrinis sp. FJH54 TaxID=3344665 RepID=UPI0035D40F85